MDILHCKYIHITKGFLTLVSYLRICGRNYAGVLSTPLFAPPLSHTSVGKAHSFLGSWTDCEWGEEMWSFPPKPGCLRAQLVSWGPVKTHFAQTFLQCWIQFLLKYRSHSHLGIAVALLLPVGRQHILCFWLVLIEEKKKKERAAHCFRSAMLLPIHLKGDLNESKEMAKWDFCHSGQCKGVQQGKPTLGKQAGSSGVI